MLVGLLYLFWISDLGLVLLHVVDGFICVGLVWLIGLVGGVTLCYLVWCLGFDVIGCCGGALVYEVLLVMLV